MRRIFTIALISLGFVSQGVAQYEVDFELNKENTVPVTITVENANFQEPVYDASISIVMREDFGHGPPHDEFVGEFTTDLSGNVVVSLLPNKDYIVTTSRSHYRTQLSKIQTTAFSRIENNKAGVSLNATDLFKVQGKVVLDEGQTEVKGSVTLINKLTHFKRTQAINPDGTYAVPAVIGEDYEVVVNVDGMLEDVVTVNKEEQMGNFEIKPYVLETPKPVFNLLMVNVDFLGKTKKIANFAELDTLSWVLNQKPDLVLNIELHTDALKSSRLNYILAQDRAEILEKELIKRNINTNQVSFIAKGEEEIINHCVNGVKCSSEEHAENDRIVFVLKTQEEVAEKEPTQTQQAVKIPTQEYTGN